MSSSRWIVGSATLTTVSSMSTIDSEPVIVARIHHFRLASVGRGSARTRRGYSHRARSNHPLRALGPRRGGVWQPSRMAAESSTSVRSLLAMPEVARTLTASLAGRLPYTAIGLLIILRVRELGGGYGEGGVAAGSFALGLACLSPFVGRLVDQRGQRAVLLPCAVASAIPLVALALVPDGTPLAAIAALAALAGIVHPP